MKVADGRLEDGSCEGENRVCFLVWLAVHWEQGLLGRARDRW